MSADIFVSHFTPSMMSPEVLERVFVQRGDLANRMVEVARESILTPAKHHTLVVGPRGTGKTHLLSLLHNRIAAQNELADRVRIAWLREEEWGVASFLDFLYRILRALAERYDDDALREETEHLFSMALKTAEARAADLLREFTEGRTLLLIAENLDSVFSGLGKKGQQRLRAHLQEEASWTIVGSSQALFGGVTLYDSPFYGFFDIHHLQELTVDDAVQLVRNVAELNSDAELAEYVQTEAGRARIRAVHHLAGGNHRVYMILSEFLTRESLDQLVDPFLRMMDDLTPYYQARMEQLSAQQRKIVDLLCHVRGAVPVKEIAKRCFITSQTASSQLKDLRDRGFVESTSVGRDAYYELSEPLMRLALEVKNQRNGYVRLFLDFLRHWYARTELADLLARVPAEAVLEREYLQFALAEDDTTESDPRIRALVEEVVKLAPQGDWLRLKQVAEALIRERGSAADWTVLGICLVQVDRYDEAIDALDKALEAEATNAQAWLYRSISMYALQQSDAAAEAIRRAAQIAPHDVGVQFGRAIVLRVVYPDMPPKSTLDRLSMRLQHRREAVQSADRALALDSEKMLSRLQHLPPMYRFPLRVRALLLLGRADEATQEFDFVTAEPEPLVGAGSIELLSDLGVSDRDLQEKLAGEIYKLYRKHRLLEPLALGLVAATVILLAADLLPSPRHNWLELWTSLAGGNETFTLPLQLLAALIEYHETQDPRVLLRLPAEERTIANAFLEGVGYHAEPPDRPTVA